jgi:hypothetical protein
VLYLLYIADLPVTLDATTAICADDTAILLAHNDPIEASTTESLHPEVAKKMTNRS